ncbi:MAG: glycosyltransferase family 4 protein [archaeon]
MRIVDICAYFVIRPTSGGQERVYEFNKAISRYAEVEQFSFTPVIMRRKRVLHSKNYHENVFPSMIYTSGVVMLKFLRIKNYDFILPALFRFIRMPASLRKAIDKAYIIQVEHPWLVGWVRRRTKKPVVLVAHNVEYDLQKDFFRKHILRKAIINSIRRSEEKAVHDSDLIFAVSKEDKAELAKLYKLKQEKIVIVPNGAPEIVPKAVKSNKDHIINPIKSAAQKKLGISGYKSVVLFIGSMHPPNEEAADFIEQELAPAIPHALFIIAGSVRESSRHDNVLCTGRVDDLQPYLDAADIAINPVLSGSGSNLKMFRYMANGLPVLTTMKGLRGIEARPGRDALVSEQEYFPDNLASLIKDDGLRAALAEGGLQVAKQYDWRIISRRALPAFNAIIRRGGKRKA